MLMITVMATFWGMMLVCFYLILAVLCSVAFPQGSEERKLFPASHFFAQRKHLLSIAK